MLAVPLAEPARGDPCVITGDDPRYCAGTVEFELSKRYLLAVHMAPAGSTFSDHETYLLESDDGENWSVVSGWEPYLGSVPEVTMREGKLYLFNPGGRRIYDLDAATVEGAPVSILDAEDDVVNFVDPSVTLDDAGRFVLFFLNSTGTPPGTDPAAGSDPKDFDSATEDEESDGAEYTLDDGPRVQGLSSDPDIFFDDERYLLYISRGSTTRVYEADSLRGSYEAVAELGEDPLLTTEGGVPAGHYDPASASYWTYVHSHTDAGVVVRRAVHEGFDAELLSGAFETVVELGDLGLTSEARIESPSFFDREAPATLTVPEPRSSAATPAIVLATLFALRIKKRRRVAVASDQAEPCWINSSMESPRR